MSSEEESISSVCVKIGVYLTVDKWLREKVGPEAFFRKRHTYRTPAQKEAAVFVTFLERFSGIAWHKNFRCTDTQKMDYEV